MGQEEAKSLEKLRLIEVSSMKLRAVETGVQGIVVDMSLFGKSMSYLQLKQLRKYETWSTVFSLQLCFSLIISQRCIFRRFFQVAAFRHPIFFYAAFLPEVLVAVNTEPSPYGEVGGPCQFPTGRVIPPENYGLELW